MPMAGALTWKIRTRAGADCPLLPARYGALVNAQHNGERTCLYMMSGKDAQGNYLTDHYIFNSRHNSWKRLKDLPRAAYLAPSVALGVSHILIASGSDGHDLDQVAKVQAPTDYQFVTDVLAYHTLTDTWATVS